MYSQKVIVRGEAAPILTFSPDRVSFGPTEVGPDKTKVVVVTANQFVTFKNWRAVVNTPAFSIPKIEVVNSRTARVHVACQPAGSDGLVTGTVSVLAEVDTCDRELDTRQVTLEIPVRGGHPPEFSISPSQLIATIDPETRRAKGTLLLRGEGAADPAIESVRCGTKPVTWKLASSAGGSSVLTVEIEGLEAGTQPALLTLSIRGKAEIKIKVYVSGYSGR
jgi:hypothetical protein